MTTSFHVAKLKVNSIECTLNFLSVIIAQISLIPNPPPVVEYKRNVLQIALGIVY